MSYLNYLIEINQDLNRNLFFNYIYHLTVLGLIQLRKLNKAKLLMDVFDQLELKKNLYIYHKINLFLLALIQANISRAKVLLNSIHKSEWIEYHSFLSMIYQLKI